MKHFKFLAISVSLLTILFACKEHMLSTIDGGSDKEINEWIYKTMETNYLWYEEIPNEENLDFSVSPENFFYTLLSDKDGRELNGKHQYFSYIEPDNQTKASTNESVYGFEFASLNTGNSYYVWVLYVLPDSPAADAGLKRGDWIVAINNEQGYITDLNSLVSGSATTFYIGKDIKYVSGNYEYTPNGSIEIADARLVEDNPFLKDTVFHAGGKSIAYLVYNHFTSGPTGNSDETYNNQMRQIFANFKAKQANELVLDLRYNGGGLVTSSQLMTSLITPPNALGDVFCYLKYNDKNTNRDYTYPLLISEASSNLNLNKIYVLTSLMTASASEAVVNCLIPYIGKENIILIGTQTLGKTVGSISFGESEKVGWILHPITLRIFNKDNEADYKNGFPPTPGFEIDELVIGQTLYELGDRRELLLSRAIQEITGQVTAKTSAYKANGKKAVNYNSFGKRRMQGLIVNP